MQPNESLIFLAAVTIMTTERPRGGFYDMAEAVMIARDELKEFIQDHRRYDGDETAYCKHGIPIRQTCHKCPYNLAVTNGEYFVPADPKLAECIHGTLLSNMCNKCPEPTARGFLKL